MIVNIKLRPIRAEYDRKETLIKLRGSASIIIFLSEEKENSDEEINRNRLDFS